MKSANLEHSHLMNIYFREELASNEVSWVDIWLLLKQKLLAPSNEMLFF